MDKATVIALARQAEGEEQQHGMWRMHVEDIQRFAALVAKAERHKVAAWMIDRGYATGHGDTTEDLLKELEWQIEEREREACAQIAEEWLGTTKDRELHIAAAIRSRNEAR